MFSGCWLCPLPSIHGPRGAWKLLEGCSWQMFQLNLSNYLATHLFLYDFYQSLSKQQQPQTALEKAGEEELYASFKTVSILMARAEAS